jgi:hypothetical protein
MKTQKEALTIQKQSKKNVSIFKFATKRKFQFFVGTWNEWLLQIS